MVSVNVQHNGKNFTASYCHHAVREAAAASRRNEFEKRLKKFARLCRCYKVSLQIVYHPSYFCGIAAELGDCFAWKMLFQAARREGPWANWDAWADDASIQYESQFARLGGWPAITKRIV
jgi:hypothetical protein